MNKNLFFFILIFLPFVTLSQKRTLLIGGTAYVGNGDKIENSVICIEGEKIDFIDLKPYFQGNTNLIGAPF